MEQEIISCRRCPRLVEWREQVGREKRRAFRAEGYWAKPVPGFGDTNARVLILGLAPGAHGSNRTGRMFTGDASGDFLYPALYRAGFASQGISRNSGDGMKLHDVYITAICRCVPPGNKPKPEEILNCREYLLRELAVLPKLEGMVALGRIAYDAALKINNSSGNVNFPRKFSHGVFIPAENDSLWLLGSYHPSRQNTQTGRLTVKMFDEIWQKVTRLLCGSNYL